MTDDKMDTADMTLPPITDEDRQFLHYNPNTDDIVRWVQAYAERAVAAERDALDSSWDALRIWKEEGERITERHAHNFLFYMGAWWSDRPWRNERKSDK